MNVFAHGFPIAKALGAERWTQAERRLARVERWLAGAFFKAVEAARDLADGDGLEALIEEASARGILKAAEGNPEIAWAETAALDMRVLGRPYEIVSVNVAAFDELWRQGGAHYVASAGEVITEAVARVARQGVYMPPPSVADLGGREWAFIDGRNRYLYTRESGFETIPLAVAREDADKLRQFAGSALPAETGRGNGLPAPDASARPYADLIDAVDLVAARMANRFASSIMAAAIAVGEVEAARLATMLFARRQAAAKLETSIDFETVNTGAMAELRLSLLRLIREVSDDQRAAILSALKDGVERGVNPRDMARMFRSSIGLTAAQENYVQNYRRALERAHASAAARANAMARAMHDGRFSRTIANAGRTGAPLSPEKIDQMVSRYRERFVNYRATTIARTEALTAVHMGDLAVWQEAVARGDINANEVLETWNTARDHRVRHTHRLMSGQERAMGVPFTSGGGAKLRFPGDPEAPARERINCRCVVTRQISEAPIEGEAAGDGQLDAEELDDTELATPKTARGYRSLAERVRPSDALDDGLDDLPVGYGRDLNEVARGHVYREGQGQRYIDVLSTDELGKLKAFYEQQIKTVADRKLVSYIEARASELPKGSAAKMVGKTMTLPSRAASFNARVAGSEGTTILQIRTAKGQPLAFLSADKQSIALPPGTKAVVRRVRYLTADEYLAETGFAAPKSGPTLLKPGKRGFKLVEVEVVDIASDVPGHLTVLEAEIAARTASLAEIERAIAQNNGARPLYSEPVPTVKISPQNGDAGWNAYTGKAFDGANDLGREVVNKAAPVRVVKASSTEGPYYMHGPGEGRQWLNMYNLSPEMPTEPGFFRHEFGHYIDDLGFGDSRVFRSARSRAAAREVNLTYEKWVEAAKAGAGDKLKYPEYLVNVADDLAQQFNIPRRYLASGDMGTARRYVESYLTKFEREFGFNPRSVIDAEDGDAALLRAYRFARGIEDGNAAEVAKAVGQRQLFEDPRIWSQTNETAHAFSDFIGSVSRLEWGVGHGPEYYISTVLAENLPGGHVIGAWRFSTLYELNTMEAFANWFNLYAKGPGERAVLRRLAPELNEKFEGILREFVGRGSAGAEGGLSLFGIRFF